MSFLQVVDNLIGYNFFFKHFFITQFFLEIWPKIHVFGKIKKFSKIVHSPSPKKKKKIENFFPDVSRKNKLLKFFWIFFGFFWLGRGSFLAKKLWDMGWPSIR